MNDLIKELSSRYDHLIFMGMRVASKDDTYLTRRWFGNGYVCVGLAASLSKNILNKYEQDETTEPLP